MIELQPLPSSGQRKRPWPLLLLAFALVGLPLIYLAWLGASTALERRRAGGTPSLEGLAARPGQEAPLAPRPSSWGNAPGSQGDSFSFIKVTDKERYRPEQPQPAAAKPAPEHAMQAAGEKAGAQASAAVTAATAALAPGAARKSSGFRFPRLQASGLAQGFGRWFSGGGSGGASQKAAPAAGGPAGPGQPTSGGSPTSQAASVSAPPPADTAPPPNPAALGLTEIPADPTKAPELPQVSAGPEGLSVTEQEAPAPAAAAVPEQTFADDTGPAMSTSDVESAPEQPGQ